MTKLLVYYSSLSMKLILLYHFLSLALLQSLGSTDSNYNNNNNKKTNNRLGDALKNQTYAVHSNSSYNGNITRSYSNSNNSEDINDILKKEAQQLLSECRDNSNNDNRNNEDFYNNRETSNNNNNNNNRNNGDRKFSNNDRRYHGRRPSEDERDSSYRNYNRRGNNKKDENYSSGTSNPYGGSDDDDSSMNESRETQEASGYGNRNRSGYYGNSGSRQGYGNNRNNRYNSECDEQGNNNYDSNGRRQYGNGGGHNEEFGYGNRDYDASRGYGFGASNNNNRRGYYKRSTRTDYGNNYDSGDNDSQCVSQCIFGYLEVLDDDRVPSETMVIKWIQDHYNSNDMRRIRLLRDARRCFAKLSTSDNSEDGCEFSQALSKCLDLDLD